MSLTTSPSYIPMLCDKRISHGSKQHGSQTREEKRKQKLPMRTKPFPSLTPCINTPPFSWKKVLFRTLIAFSILPKSYPVSQPSPTHTHTQQRFSSLRVFQQRAEIPSLRDGGSPRPRCALLPSRYPYSSIAPMFSKFQTKVYASPG